MKEFITQDLNRVTTKKKKEEILLIKPLFDFITNNTFLYCKLYFIFSLAFHLV